MADPDFYAVVRVRDGAVVKEFGAIPNYMPGPGRRRLVNSPPKVGDEATLRGETYRLVGGFRVDWDAPAPYHDKTSETDALDGGALTRTRTWTAWDAARIDAHEAQQARDRAAFLDRQQDAVRAAALVLNERLNAIFDAAEASTSLADFKQRMAAIAAAGGAMTPAELKAEVERRVRKSG